MHPQTRRPTDGLTDGQSGVQSCAHTTKNYKYNIFNFRAVISIFWPLVILASSFPFHYAGESLFIVVGRLRMSIKGDLALRLQFSLMLIPRLIQRWRIRKRIGLHNVATKFFHLKTISLDIVHLGFIPFSTFLLFFLKLSLLKKELFIQNVI